MTAPDGEYSIDRPQNLGVYDQAEAVRLAKPDAGDVEAAEHSNKLEDRLKGAIVHKFEGMGEAWTTDNSGDILARVAAQVVLTELGLCSCGNGLPCIEGGRGL